MESLSGARTLHRSTPTQAGEPGKAARVALAAAWRGGVKGFSGHEKTHLIWAMVNKFRIDYSKK
jgi:hypothetical protein